MRKVSREMSSDWALEIMRKAPYITVSFTRADGTAYGVPLSLACASDNVRIGSIVPVIVRFMGWLLKTITIIGEILFRVWNWCPCPRNMA